MKICPYCQKEVQDNTVKCRFCGGWFSNDADTKQGEIDKQERMEKLVQGKEPDKAGAGHPETVYFSIATLKLVVLSILTFGLYELYWFWKNWKAVRDQEGIKIRPFWRAFFSVFYCYSLFKRIVLSAQEKGYKPKQSAGSLAVAYILILMMNSLPDPIGYISMLTFLAIIPVCDAIRHANASLQPQLKESSGVGTGEVIAGVLGFLMWLLLLAGIFLEPGAGAV